MNARQTFMDETKEKIDVYVDEILKFLSSSGKSNVKAALFMETYLAIQRASDEYDASNLMYSKY